MATHRSGRSGAANSTAETPYMPNRALSFRIITYRPARSLAAQRSCRPRTRMAPSSAYIPASARFRAATIRVVGAQISQIAAALSLVRPAWSAGIGSLWSRSSVCEAPMSRTLAPPKEGRGPWCELGRGPDSKTIKRTLQADGGYHDDCRCDTHCYRRGGPCIRGALLCGFGVLLCHVCP